MPVPAHPRLAARIAATGAHRYVVAARAGLNPNALGGIIAGRVEPTADQRQRIADALDATPDELFERTDTAGGGQ